MPVEKRNCIAVVIIIIIIILPHLSSGGLLHSRYDDDHHDHDGDGDGGGGDDEMTVVILTTTMLIKGNNMFGNHNLIKCFLPQKNPLYWLMHHHHKMVLSCKLNNCRKYSITTTKPVKRQTSHLATFPWRHVLC